MTTRRGFLGALLTLAAAPAVAGFMPTPIAVVITPSRYINALDYGADLTGERDSTEAIRRAMWAAGPGNTVFFPPGTYRAGTFGFA